VILRPVEDGDLPVFFEQQLDEVSNRMAAVPARDREAFFQHWERIRADAGTIIRTIVVDDRVAGYVLSFERGGVREVGYWIGRECWGRGIASGALAQFLRIDTARPLHARVAKHNAASLHVAQKSGFVITGEGRMPPDVDPEQIDEFVLTLAAPRAP
jgi:RimJ/RimL family protein N-acetyltransferase